MPKADKLETDKRIEAARILILRGEDGARICQNLSAAFNVTDRQARRYVAQAREQISAITQVEQAVMLAEHVSVRRHLRAEAIKAGDLRTALASAQDEAKLFDLYPAQKSEVSGPGGAPILVRVDR